MNDEDEILLCIECAKDIRLKKLIQIINTKGFCTCCGNTKYIIDIYSNEFIQMTKALIRYHYSEWDYNEHWGGNGYTSLFYEDDNVFFNKQNFKDNEVYDELIDRIACFEVYEDYDKGVSIFAGYYEGEQNPLLQSIKSSLDYSIIEIEDKLKNENYFKFEEKIIQILSEYSEICKSKIEKNSEFYRARIGYADSKRSILGGGFEGEIIFQPYSNSEMGAPPPNLAGFGRINRAGVSYLYCASDKYTAISEIRPHPGDIVSIGKFIANKELFIFDVTETQFLKFYHNDESLYKFKKLNTFTELMQKVIPPSERQAYNITQLIADCARKLKFDGILFPSSVGNGENLVVFNPEYMNYTYENAEIVEIKEVKYEYFKRQCTKDISEIQ
ncbi:RES family NAD+ phosphorylase [Flavobacterium caseinilyticum]|uniref:RES domain-containing protein n=1 Tax=Flavobacterium caseinilyticum TaxID=2541732 RepID=A0A4R5AUB9_9FLAO|nr:RES family NAD+ phosphorylase [Flavobacterium caseinilyticum]TDD75630.1 RES domain-containing protein [Flavobacterium caseinilyticum]